MDLGVERLQRRGVGILRRTGDAAAQSTLSMAINPPVRSRTRQRS